jgi:hypothetical protein
MKITMPQEYKIVTALTSTTTNGALTGDYVSLKNAKRVTVVVEMLQAAAHATVISINQASAVDGTGTKVITNVVPIWANEDVATTDTLVKQTSAVNYTITADTNNKLVVFQIDPATLDMANSFDCITVKTTASSEVTDFASAVYYIETKYAQATPPAAITD